MLTDTSQTNRIKFLVNKTLAIARQNYPTDYEGGNKTFPESELLNRQEGQKLVQCCPEAAPPCTPGTIMNLNITSANPEYNPQSPYDNYNFWVTFSWNPLPNATGYTITTNDTSNTLPTILYTPGTTNATMYYNGDFGSGYVDTIITVTAQTSCGSTSATTQAAPCFLAGSLVQMANGETKPIEDVKVGDLVLGAFGEINSVIALHRPTLGTALMCKINNTHSTTNHHPHVSIDKEFYCGNPLKVDNETYGRVHKVIDAEGNEVDMMLHGLYRGRTLKLELGVNLKTVEGSREVTALETYSLPADTQLYNLVTSGSHTYHVDGYAVTGWPREDDFDYDLWKPRG